MSSSASTSTTAPPGAATSPTTAGMLNSVINVKDQVLEGDVDTTETSARYLGLLGRIRPVLLPAARYLAYTSDIGEAFRPVVNRRLVTASYGISVAYVVGDIGYEGYRATLDRKDRLQAGGTEQPGAGVEVGLRVARRTVFQGLASIILPAFTIHSAVKYSAPLFLKSSNPRIKGWGPTAVGLAIVPALPVMFDHPVETATDTVFDWVEENWVGSADATRAARRHHHGGAAHEKPSSGKSEL